MIRTLIINDQSWKWMIDHFSILKCAGTVVSYWYFTFCTFWELFRFINVSSVLPYSNMAIFVSPPLDTKGIMFLGCLSIHLCGAWNNTFHLYMGPCNQPWLFLTCSSIRWHFQQLTRKHWREWSEILHAHVSSPPSFCWFSSFLRHWLSWCSLITFRTNYIIQTVLIFFSHYFHLLKQVKFWVSTHFPEEYIKEMAWNFAFWCILATFRTN